jgi:hypothetical protein
MRFEIHERVHGATDDKGIPRRSLVAIDVATGNGYLHPAVGLDDIPSSGWFRWDCHNLGKFGFVGMAEFALSVSPDSP